MQIGSHFSEEVMIPIQLAAYHNTFNLRLTKLSSVRRRNQITKVCSLDMAILRQAGKYLIDCSPSLSFDFYLRIVSHISHRGYTFMRTNGPDCGFTPQPNSQ